MATFLLEVGTEELPASFVDEAITQWNTNIQKNLEEEYLNPEAIEIYGTPRRLSILIKGLPEKQEDREEELKGPPVKSAFKDGKPTNAAEGFAKKQGISIEDFEIRDTEKGEFIFVNKKIQGQWTKEILKELTPKWITSLEGRRFMRWGDGDIRFPRPIRTLVALWNEEILPIELVNGSTKISTNRKTYGHRVLNPHPIEIPQALDYLDCMQKAYVEVDYLLRKNKIKQQIESAAKELGGIAEISPDLLAEVTNLVEWPTAVVGKFDTEFLDLPPEVIITVMVTHQRYFPIKINDQIMANFITISNGDPAKSEIIAAGNERVIRARLADAKFFYKADTDESFESYLPQLENVTFQEDLGSIRDKVDRILVISQQIAEQLNLNKEETGEIESTALLCKADLVTQMVYEFPELQGVIGEKYALISGESANVAKGIFEHYLPRGADDLMPESFTGQVVGIADRLDTLVSIFGLGMIPTGSSDPFALRRAANSVIEIIWHGNLKIDLGEIIRQASNDFITSHPDKESPLQALEEFFVIRIKTLLQDEKGIDYDLVNAVLGENDIEYTQRAFDDLLDVRDRASFLQSIRDNKRLDAIYETVNRSTRLAIKGDLDTKELEPTNIVRTDLFEKSSEQAFYQAILDLVPKTQKARSQSNYELLVDALTEIAPTVSKFFDGEDSVLVMDENPEIKANRLNLLGLLRNHARVLADFGAIVKS